MSIITLPPGVPPAMGHEVYVRSSWSGAWVLIPGLQCLDCSWSTAPSIPTATLMWRFGQVKQPWSPSFATDTPLNLANSYVRIRFLCDHAEEAGPEIREWVGICQATETQLSGGGQLSGMQVYSCYGLELLLSQFLIDGTYWYDGSTTKFTSFPHVFNRGNRPNRDVAKEGGSFVYSPNIEHAQFWSTLDIIEYLLLRHTPKNEAGERSLAFGIASDLPLGVLPDWDRPEMDPQGQTTYSAIDRLLTRDRLLSWWIEYYATSNQMLLRANTLITSPITLPNSATIPANDTQREIRFDADPLTSAAIKESVLEQVDQVVCRGGQRVSVGTLRFDEGNLIKGWPMELEAEYEAAASGSAGYDALGRRFKQEKNQEVRSSAKLEDCFSKIEIPWFWPKLTGGPFGSGEPFFPVFGDLGPTDQPYPVYTPPMTIQPRTPLFAGVNYAVSTTAIEEPAVEREELGPLVLFKVPATGEPPRHVQAERIGENAKLERVNKNEPTFSVQVGVSRDIRGTKLRVSGGPQHNIAASEFTPLPDDPDHGEYDYREAYYTFAILDDRYAEGVYPAEIVEDEIETIDAVKRKVILCSEAYRQEYLVPGTVCGTTESGSLMINVDGGFLTDDTEELTSLAEIAWQWYGQPRNVLTLETPRSFPVTSLKLGDYIAAVGDPAGFMRRDIGSVVTQINVRVPVGTGLEGDSPVQSWRWVTGSGEIDPQQIFPLQTASSARAEIMRERERVRVREMMRRE